MEVADIPKWLRDGVLSKSHARSIFELKVMNQELNTFREVWGKEFPLRQAEALAKSVSEKGTNTSGKKKSLKLLAYRAQ